MKLYPDDWPLRLTIGVTTAAFSVVTLLLCPLVGIYDFWPRMTAVIVAVFAANLLGRRIYQRLFPPSPGGPPTPPPRA